MNMILNYQPSSYDLQNYQIKHSNQFKNQSNVIELKYKYFLLNKIDSDRTKYLLWLFILCAYSIYFLVSFIHQILFLYPIIILFGYLILQNTRIKTYTKYKKKVLCNNVKLKQILNYISSIFFVLIRKLFFNRNLKCIVFIFLLFSPRPVYSSQKSNTTDSTKSDSCVDDNIQSAYQLEYDENLFNELKMQDTLVNLYRSCYKNKHNDPKSSKITNTKPGQNICRKNPTKSKDILVGLLFNKENILLPQDVLKRIDQVCSNEINDLSKIYLLADYDHSVCGNVYRNSIKTSHLKKYILGEHKQERVKRSTFHGISNHHHHHNKHHDYIQSEYSRKVFRQSGPYLNLTDFNLNKIDTIDKNTSENISNLTDFNNNFNKTNKITLSNCTLILLNIYLLSHTASCDFEDFVESLNHFDCLSNNFSVKSDCEKCQNAYKKWLCSEIIPYYHEQDKIAKPCQRFCYTVQNLCPFFRPVDNYGGQPVFHCRNVIQVLESRPDGYEDDDENYFDDDKYDDDRCYGECTKNINQTIIEVDLNRIFKEKIKSFGSFNSTLIQELPIGSVFELWFKQSSNGSAYSNESNFNISFNTNGRFKNVKECFFGFQPISSSSGYQLNIVYNIFFIVIFKFLIP